MNDFLKKISLVYKNPARFHQALRCRIGLGPSVVSAKVLGKPVKARYGVIPLKPDYDEGWNYYFITQSSVMFDVGCNMGWCTLLSCLDNPQRPVVAFDANPKALTGAAETLFINGFSQQVQFVLGFASDKEGENFDFYTVGTGSAGSRFRSHAKTASAKNSHFKTRSFTLDGFAKKYNHRPDFVKVDVEGAEAETLEGAKSIARLRETKFLIEMHATKEVPMVENGTKILKWCSEWGYEAYYLKQHKLITSSEIIAHRGRCHLLLQPAGWSYPELLLQIKESDDIEKVNMILKNSGRS